MLSRRKEPFRYVFAVPAKGLFSIREVDGRDISSRSAEASMVNFHKSDCRIRSVLDLNAEEHDIKLLLSYTLSDTPLELEGLVRWQQRTENGCDYGIRFELNEEQKNDILVSLRALAAAKQIFAD